MPVALGILELFAECGHGLAQEYHRDVGLRQPFWFLPSSGCVRRSENPHRLDRDLDASQRGSESLLVFEQPIDEVACLLSTGAERQPYPEELASALRLWHDKYGVRLQSWNGSGGVGLSVERPPNDLSDLRDFAREFQLICAAPPVDDLNVAASRASKLLVLVAERRLDCEW